MDWIQMLTIMGGNAAVVISLFLWNRAESNADRRDIMLLVQTIKDEMKDFHGRLCSLEARYHAEYYQEKEGK